MVLFVGSGASGLATSMQLTKFGVHVTIVEGRERTGGRAFGHLFVASNSTSCHLNFGQSWTGTQGNAIWFASVHATTPADTSVSASILYWTLSNHLHCIRLCWSTSMIFNPANNESPSIYWVHQYVMQHLSFDLPPLRLHRHCQMPFNLRSAPAGSYESCLSEK